MRRKPNDSREPCSSARPSRVVGEQAARNEARTQSHVIVVVTVALRVNGATAHCQVIEDHRAPRMQGVRALSRDASLLL
jgi:hypothetical protein